MTPSTNRDKHYKKIGTSINNITHKLCVELHGCGRSTYGYTKRYVLGSLGLLNTTIGNCYHIWVNSGDGDGGDLDEGCLNRKRLLCN